MVGAMQWHFMAASDGVATRIAEHHLLAALAQAAKQPVRNRTFLDDDHPRSGNLSQHFDQRRNGRRAAIPMNQPSAEGSDIADESNYSTPL